MIFDRYFSIDFSVFVSLLFLFPWKRKEGRRLQKGDDICHPPPSPDLESPAFAKFGTNLLFIFVCAKITFSFLCSLTAVSLDEILRYYDITILQYYFFLSCSFIAAVKVSCACGGHVDISTAGCAFLYFSQNSGVCICF